MTPEREAEIRKMLADLASVLGEGPHACAWSDPVARAACPPDEILCPWHDVHDTHAALTDLLAALDEERKAHAADLEELQRRRQQVKAMHRAFDSFAFLMDDDDALLTADPPSAADAAKPEPPCATCGGEGKLRVHESGCGLADGAHGELNWNQHGECDRCFPRTVPCPACQKEDR